MNKRNLFKILPISAAVLLTACGGSGGSTDTGNNNEEVVVETSSKAVIQTVTPTFDASGVHVIDVEDYEISESILTKDQSDYAISGYGEHFYHIGRFFIDEVSKYNVNDPTVPVFESYSTLDSPEDASKNPHDLVFVSEEKAYLVLFGDDVVWIVNPSAESEEDFKIGELDLSAYEDSADGDPGPEVNDGIVVDGKLFLSMTRLDRGNGWAPDTSYIAVFDTATDTEIDTDATDAAENLLGIALDLKNTNSFDYNSDFGLTIDASGDRFGGSPGREDQYTGGVIRIDPDDYSVEVILDDGPDLAESNDYGFISGNAIIDSENAFFIGYAAWQTTYLYHYNPTTSEVLAIYNPTTGNLEDIVEDFEYDALDIRAIKAGPDGNLWVAIADTADPRILVMSVEGEIVETLPLFQNPATANVITFLTVADE